MLQNRIITTALNLKDTPYSLWHGRRAKLSHFHPFGCMGYRVIQKEIRNGKFESVTSVGVLIGKSEENRNYEILDLETNKIHISHNVSFQPMVFPLRKEKSSPLDWDFLDEHGLPVEDEIVTEVPDDQCQTPIDDDEDVIRDDTPRLSNRDLEATDDEAGGEMDNNVPQEEQEHDQVDTPQPRRSNRDRRPVDRYSPGDTAYVKTSNYLHKCQEAMKSRAEPKSYKMAMKSKDAKAWREACDKEMKNIMNMGVWEIVDRPKNSPVVGGRWHFKLKLNPDGSINKHKARYVAKGYTQTEGVDYNDTYAPTGRLASFRILVAVAAAKGWSIEQMDAIAAFLNSDLQEEIYLELPEGYDEERANRKVAKLKKALYGLKQSARCWSDEVKDKFTAMNLIQNPHDACLWYSKTTDGRETLIYLHVDDMAITGNNIDLIKETLKLKWKMEDLGPAHCVVGLKIHSTITGGYSLSQGAMIQTVLERFRVEDCKPASTPFPGGTKITRASDVEVQEFKSLNLPYNSLVGSLMYIAQGTRPDIAYAVGALSQHLAHPSMPAWNMGLHVLRYLKGTQHVGLVYDGRDSTIVGNQSWHFPECHTESDWAGDPTTRRSTTGYLFKLNGAAVSWRSKLQPTVSLSSTEAEYKATTEAGQEVVWLRGLLENISISQPSPTVLCSDSTGAVSLTSKSIFHARTKHIEVQHHWIREQVLKKSIILRHISNKQMFADTLTKPLHPGPFREFRDMTGLDIIDGHLKQGAC